LQAKARIESDVTMRQLEMMNRTKKGE